MIERRSTLTAMVHMLEELLDAHLDTVVMALDDSPDGDWLSHVDYLRALHRHGESVLARLAGDERGGASRLTVAVGD